MCEIKDFSSVLGQSNAISPSSYKNLKDINNKYIKMDLSLHTDCETNSCSLLGTTSKISTLVHHDSPNQNDGCGVFPLNKKTLVNTESLQDRVSNWTQSIETPYKGKHLTYNYKNLNFFQRIYNVIAKLFGFELINTKKESNSPFSDAYTTYGKSALKQNRNLGEKRSVSFQEGHTKVLLDRESEMSENAQTRGKFSNKYSAHTKPVVKKRRDGTIKILKKYGPLASWEAKNDIDQAKLQKKLYEVLKTKKN